METVSFLNSPIYTWILLPVLIFSARIFDVTLGTIRVIFVTRGMKYLSAMVGFVEVLIWLLAIGQIFRNLSNIACYLAYAGGFASGNFIGIWIVEKLSIGKTIIRIVTVKDATKLVQFLKSENYGVTTLCAQGAEGPVKVIFSIVNRQDLEHVVGTVKKFNPHAFYSIEDVRFAAEGIFPKQTSFLRWNYWEMFRPHRKSK